MKLHHLLPHAAAFCCVSGLNTASAQTPNLDYLVTSYAEAADIGGSGPTNRGSANPYAAPILESSAAEVDIVAPGTYVGPSVKSFGHVSAYQGNLSMYSESDLVILAENASGNIPLAEAFGIVEAEDSLPISFTTTTVSQPWSCDVSFVTPGVSMYSTPLDLSGDLTSGADATVSIEMNDAISNPSYTYSAYTSAGGPINSMITGGQPFTESGNGNTLVWLSEDFRLDTDVGGFAGGNGAWAQIDPDLPLIFSDLSPGPTISVDGVQYAPSVSTPEPGVCALLGSLSLTVFGFVRRRKAAGAA